MCFNIFNNLLASALTLSISPNRVTSLSIRLAREKQQGGGGRDDSVTKIRACTLTLHSHGNEISRLQHMSANYVWFYFYIFLHFLHKYQYETIQFQCVCDYVCGIYSDWEIPPSLEGISSVWLALQQGLKYIHYKVVPVVAPLPAVVKYVNYRQDCLPGTGQVPIQVVSQFPWKEVIYFERELPHNDSLVTTFILLVTVV